jgi:hypothetical protein
VDEEIVMIIHATLTEYEKLYNLLEGRSKGKRVLLGVYIGDLIIEDKEDHYRVFKKKEDGIIGGGFEAHVKKGNYQILDFFKKP